MSRWESVRMRNYVNAQKVILNEKKLLEFVKLEYKKRSGNYSKPVSGEIWKWDLTQNKIETEYDNLEKMRH